MRRARDSRARELLGGAGEVLVIWSPASEPEDERALGVPRGSTAWRLVDPVPAPRDWGGVLLVVRDLLDLRHSVSAIAGIGSARVVAVRFQRRIDRLPTVVPRPQWELAELEAGREPDSRVVLAFDVPTLVRPVLIDLARAASPAGRLDVAWPSLAARRAAPDQWPPADPGAKVAVLSRLVDGSGELPPDLVLVDPASAERVGHACAVHPVLGREPLLAVVEPALSWEEWRDLPPDGAGSALAARGPASLGPVDQHVVNPIGFDRDPQGGVATLGDREGRSREASVVRVDGRWSEVDVAGARSLRGVELAWSGGRGPQDYCRRVVELAAAGVPLTTDRTPEWARHLLPDDLADAVERPVDLADRLRREEHSVLLRRAALRTYAAPAWRRRLARSYGLQETAAPGVSIVLATRRPEMVPFALRQVARQRGVVPEVVLATHGFAATPESLQAFREADAGELTTVEVDREVPFGGVLDRAAARASGDLLLKMDDDDWYGPDFVTDLVLARDYSGADVVGCSAEFTFLAQLRTTTRQVLPTESYRALVAGGTMLVDRGVFRALGGFQHAVKHVDAGLLGAVRDAGGSTYRTHGLGYVLRRGLAGHTWDPGVGYFLTGERAAEQWRGFRPSALLEPDEIDLPEERDARLREQ